MMSGEGETITGAFELPVLRGRGVRHCFERHDFVGILTPKRGIRPETRRENGLFACKA